MWGGNTRNERNVTPVVLGRGREGDFQELLGEHPVQSIFHATKHPAAIHALRPIDVNANVAFVCYPADVVPLGRIPGRLALQRVHEILVREVVLKGPPKLVGRMRQLPRVVVWESVRVELVWPGGRVITVEADSK